jgi:hypothetical protein
VVGVSEGADAVSSEDEDVKGVSSRRGLGWVGGGGEDLKFPSASLRYANLQVGLSETTDEEPPDIDEEDPSDPSGFGT